MAKTNELCDSNVKYEQIFSDNVKTQELVANILYHRLEKRNLYITPTNRGPADPRKRKTSSLGIKEVRQRTKTKHGET